MNKQLLTMTPRMRGTISVVFSFLISFSVHADIYQWYDWDGDGSKWLSDSTVEPNADLSGQLLWWANLSDATLVHANFQNTNLDFSTLARASLSQANFTGASLHGVNFTDADLTNADLTTTDLRFANVKDANLFHANMSNANLSNLRNWEDAMWLAALYNANTIFPEGMHPEELAMIELQVPAPAVGFVFLYVFIKPRRRVQTH